MEVKSEKLKVKSFASGIFYSGLKQSLCPNKIPLHWRGARRRSRPTGASNFKFFALRGEKTK
jgi:hypothetical protein